MLVACYLLRVTCSVFGQEAQQVLPAPLHAYKQAAADCTCPASVPVNYQPEAFCLHVWHALQARIVQVCLALVQVTKAAFQQLLGKEPKVAAIHAGLECGIIGEKVPGMDAVSYGPTITGAHSPDEQVSLLSLVVLHNPTGWM